MVDYQYLPMKTNEDGSHESFYEKIRLNKLIPLKEFMSQEVPLFIPPMMFARVDRPCEFHYKQEMKHRANYRNPDNDRPPNLIGTGLFTLYT